MENELKLITKNDEVLVYIPSKTFEAKITRDDDFFDLYIHVRRKYGSVTVYKDNDVNRLVNIDIELQQYILKLAENDR